MAQRARFDWDSGNLLKCQKHGVTIEEIEHLFRAGARILPSPVTVGGETRHIAVGEASSGRPMFVAFTVRGTADHQLIRPISARYMHAKEAERYAKAR